MEVLFCRAEGPGPLSVTTGLVAMIQCFHCGNPALISGWEPKPRSKTLQAEDTRDQRSVLSISYFLDTQVTSAQNPRFTLHSLVATGDNSGHTEFWGSYKGWGTPPRHTQR